ncbi:DNA adenine methylase [Planctellipticum variicoloris]|uniref:DNA adenine methylase n=1 Tax=Planctellipticum variicoloris TaxID=3064265 RepID=UPI0030133869|nr:DNA adenine methylase [Planctomycetaceae bacterium SH412]
MLNQIVPWYGSKPALSRHILPEFGPHRAYWEPLTGGFGMIFKKERCRFETLNDLHGDMINLARTVASSVLCAALVRRLSRRLNCEATHKDALERQREPFVEGVDRAADFFCVCWMSMNGYAGTTSSQSFATRFKNSGDSKPSKFRAALASIRAWHDRLQNVTILQRDGFDVLGRIADEAGTLIYCDPPYVVKGGKYRHDFVAEDHARLAAALARFQQARVIVSYYDHPLLDQLYAGWHKRILSEWTHHPQNGVKKVKPPEILLINGPSLAASVPPSTTSSTRKRARAQQLAV